jgi:hypothetical protein
MHLLNIIRVVYRVTCIVRSFASCIIRSFVSCIVRSFVSCIVRSYFVSCVRLIKPMNETNDTRKERTNYTNETQTNEKRTNDTRKRDEQKTQTIRNILNDPGCVECINLKSLSCSWYKSEMFILQGI